MINDCSSCQSEEKLNMIENSVLVYLIKRAKIPANTLIVKLHGDL